MMTPLRRVTGGGDQEKTTSLCPATASTISGAPAGAGNSKTKKSCHMYKPLLTELN